MKAIPYRITIELAIGETGKTMQLTGETLDLGYGETLPDSGLCALAANALLWQSNNLASMATDHATYERMRHALNLPLNQVPY